MAGNAVAPTTGQKQVQGDVDSQRSSPSTSASGSTSSIITRESSQTSLSSGLTPPLSVAQGASNSGQPLSPSAAQSTAQAPSTPSPPPYASSIVPQYSSAPSPSRQNLSAASEYDSTASGARLSGPSLISPVIGAIGTAARDPHSVMSVGDMLSATELRRRSQGLGPMPPAEIRSMMDMVITHHLRESEEMEERKRKGKNVSGCEKN